MSNMDHIPQVKMVHALQREYARSKAVQTKSGPGSKSIMFQPTVSLATLKRTNARLGKMWQGTLGAMQQLQRADATLQVQLKRSYYVEATITTLHHWMQSLDKVVAIKSAADSIASLDAAGFAKRLERTANQIRKAVQTRKFSDAQLKAFLRTYKQGKPIYEAIKEQGPALGDAFGEISLLLNVEAATTAPTEQMALAQMADFREAFFGDIRGGIKEWGTTGLKAWQSVETYVAAKAIEKTAAKRQEIEQAITSLHSSYLGAVTSHRAINHAYWSLSAFIMRADRSYRPPYPINVASLDRGFVSAEQSALGRFTFGSMLAPV